MIETLSYSQQLKDLLLSMVVNEETARPSIQQVYDQLISVEDMPLVCVKRDEVSVFHIPNNAWISHPLPFPVEVDIYTQYVWIDDVLLCCGGITYTG